MKWIESEIYKGVREEKNMKNWKDSLKKGIEKRRDKKFRKGKGKSEKKMDWK